MAQIRSKQIADFLSTVEWASVTNSQIANASDIKSYVDAAISLEHTHHTDEAASLEALISSANNDLSSVDARILAEEGRVDAILLAADADKDSFAEIVSLINAVDTVNDDALAVVIGNLNSEISSTNVDVASIDARITAEELALSNEIAATNGDVSSLNAALAAEVSATNADFVSSDARLTTVEGNLATEIATTNTEVSSINVALAAEIAATNGDVTSINAALAAEIAATNGDVTSIDARFTSEVASVDAALAAEIAATNTDVTSINAALAAEIAATNTDVTSINAALAAEIAATNADVTSLATVDAGLDARLVTLEGTIMEDNEQSVEVFAGAGLSYSVTNPVQDDNKNLVDVYVNGQRVLVGSVSGTAIELLSPGYVIDAADQVIVVYQY